MKSADLPVATLHATTGEYAVFVRHGLLASLPARLRTLAPAWQYALITDSTVDTLYKQRLLDALRAHGLRADAFVFPAGEANKTRETWASLTDAMLERGLGRDACVIALGGGVVTDLGGFVAATYMRGLPLVLLPTTLLAMIDAAIGGKTGVDAGAGKNLVGAFHAPRCVLADPDVLATLPDATLREGIAEAVKHGAIADADYLVWLEQNAHAILRRAPDALLHLIHRSVEIKADFVNRDEREAGPRAALNFGHTVGHAIERLSGYAIPHGHAVAMGMVTEARIGEAMGRTAPGTAHTLEATLRAFELPVAPPAQWPAAAVAAAAGTDKKARASRVRYTLLVRPGEVARDGEAWTVAASDGALEAALRSA